MTDVLWFLGGWATAWLGFLLAWAVATVEQMKLEAQRRFLEQLLDHQ